MKSVIEYANWFVEEAMVANGAIVNGNILVSSLEKKLNDLEFSEKLFLIERIGKKCDLIISSNDSQYEEMEFLGMYVSDQYVILTKEKPTFFKYYSPLD